MKITDRRADSPVPVKGRDQHMREWIIRLIQLYQKYLSPLKTTKCPYIPSCSAYAIEAVRKHGVLKGVVLSSWRLLRCNPFSHGGYDPVPEENGIWRKNRW